MNALDSIKEDLMNHQVKITLPGQKTSQTLCLIIVTANTSLVEDMKKAYPDINGTQVKIANKLFGDKKTDNSFGVFIDPVELKYIYGFNMDFAEYDSKTGKVVFKDLDEFLTEKLPEKPGKADKPKQTSGDLDFHRRRREGGYRPSHRVLIKYAVTEKEERKK